MELETYLYNTLKLVEKKANWEYGLSGHRAFFDIAKIIRDVLIVYEAKKDLN
jgi:hypothetical protein